MSCLETCVALAHLPVEDRRLASLGKLLWISKITFGAKRR